LKLGVTTARLKTQLRYRLPVELGVRVTLALGKPLSAQRVRWSRAHSLGIPRSAREAPHGWSGYFEMSGFRVNQDLLTNVLSIGANVPFRAIFRRVAGRPFSRRVSRCATSRHTAARTSTDR